jgi:CheY-like chemotaxis protein
VAYLTNERAGPINRTVLYIEDNPHNTRLVERLLELRPRTELHVATNARDGLKAAIDERPDLILLDNRLPDATGSDVLRQLASSTATADIPVVVLTGDSSGTTADELLAVGASEYIMKPYDIHEFMSMIDRYLPSPE